MGAPRGLESGHDKPLIVIYPVKEIVSKERAYHQKTFDQAVRNRWEGGYP